MPKPAPEMQAVTRPLEILTLPSGSTVGPGVFIYNRFNETQDDGIEEHGTEAVDVELEANAADSKT